MDNKITPKQFVIGFGKKPQFFLLTKKTDVLAIMATELLVSPIMLIFLIRLIRDRNKIRGTLFYKHYIAAILTVCTASLILSITAFSLAFKNRSGLLTKLRDEQDGGEGLKWLYVGVMATVAGASGFVTSAFTFAGAGWSQDALIRAVITSVFFSFLIALKFIFHGMKTLFFKAKQNITSLVAKPHESVGDASFPRRVTVKKGQSFKISDGDLLLVDGKYGEKVFKICMFADSIRLIGEGEEMTFTLMPNRKVSQTNGVSESYLEFGDLFMNHDKATSGIGLTKSGARIFNIPEDLLDPTENRILECQKHLMSKILTYEPSVVMRYRRDRSGSVTAEIT